MDQNQKTAESSVEIQTVDELRRLAHNLMRGQI